MGKQKFTAPVTSIEYLTQLLLATEQEYLLDSQLPANIVYFKFIGSFEDSPVVWNASVQTMEVYSQQHEVTDDPKQFIEIKVKDHVHYVNIGLNIAVIDKATVGRTILMIRNYKRLHRGRHEFGARSKTL